MRGIKIVEGGRDGLFVSMPSRKTVDGYSEVCFPVTAEFSHGENHLESYGAKKDFPLGGKRVIGTPAHYAYLKIAEGCNNRCHYCAIPGIRGPLHSRDLADCVAEARWLAGEGVKELIVVAQDPTAYGEDWGKPGSICVFFVIVAVIAITQNKITRSREVQQ